MNTWSGQPESSAWHWTSENRKKLGNVIYLLTSGGAKGREQAYQEFIELKRNFIEEEFDEYLNHLDDFRDSMGSEPLRKIMEEIRGERAPVTGWKAKEGRAFEPVMLPEMEPRKHVALKHNGNCHCAICEGGLFQCSVCNGAEGQLTTECCGHKVKEELLDAVYHGHIDFVGGKWVSLEEPLQATEPPVMLLEMGNKTVDPVTVTRYDLFITLIKRGYHALEM